MTQSVIVMPNGMAERITLLCTFIVGVLLIIVNCHQTAHHHTKTLDTQITSQIFNIAQQLLAAPRTCTYHGSDYPCMLAVSCWIQGKKAIDLCSGGMFWSCCIPRNATPTGNNLIKNPACGKVYIRNSKIIGGENAELGNQPWHLSPLGHAGSPNAGNAQKRKVDDSDDVTGRLSPGKSDDMPSAFGLIDSPNELNSLAHTSVLEVGY
ncbi:uncharacterized protein LOC111613584 [Centruroides sculpturatus]|uniref:uncharacterized protein LOC111613584 n=1 Tax=Centruroides sculpturatus TaxID=218467 RepID=UPI000C6D4031|nr:uncharacterized protein LOC111613584 [Centruroides sculpturatus]